MSRRRHWNNSDGVGSYRIGLHLAQWASFCQFGCYCKPVPREETPMTNEQLQQIAEWCGFKRTGEYWYICPDHGDWYDKDLPDFLHSLDACFRWIVPKLREEGCIDILFNYKIGICCYLDIDTDYIGEGLTESEAFCEAVLKYISEVKK
jgi:hypothetical protein